MHSFDKEISFFLIFSLLIMLDACGSHSNEKQPADHSQQSKDVGKQIKAKPDLTTNEMASEKGPHFVTEFKFEKGSYQLTQANKNTIKEMYQKADRKGQIEEVQLITWADREFPTEERGELTDIQQRLVEERNNSIEKYLNELDKDLEVEKISMAERTGMVARFLSSDEVNVKEHMETKDAPKKISKGMVIFVMKPTQF